MTRTINILGKAAFRLKKQEIPHRVDKILFFKIGALGDVLMTTPLVRAVKTHTNARVDYACGKSFAQALEGNIYVDHIITFDENIFYKKKRERIEDLARRIRENDYDIIFILDKHWALGVFGHKCGNFRIGFDRNGEGFANNLNVIYKQQKHDILSYLDMGLFLGIRTTDTKMDIFPARQDSAKARKMVKTKNYVCIASGGGNPGQPASFKIWPKKNFLGVVNQLSKRHNIVLLGGANDRKITDWIHNRAERKGKIKNLAGTTSVRESAEILKRTKFLITNDSGIMHIASAVNSRIISIFGPTSPRILGPLNKSSITLWKEKNACYDIYGNFKNCDRAIMKKITMEDVLNAAKTITRNKKR